MSSARKRPNPNALNLDSDSDSDSGSPRSTRQRSKRPFQQAVSPTPPPAAAESAAGGDDDDDEDDYMNMVIAEPTVAETYSQRKKREQREAEIRGCPKSKAELAEIEKERLIAERGKREAALSKSLLDDATAAGSNHKGLRMMKMMGFKPGSALGKQRSPLPESSSGDSPGGGNKNWIPTEARLEPIGVVVKEDRGGIGHVTAQRAKVKAAFGDVKKQEMTPDEYRQRVAEEREEKLKESQFYAAQKVCEGFDTERDHPGEAAKGKDLVGKERTVPLKNINVLWRGLVKHREGKEKERRMRYDLMQSLDQPRLPGYDRNHELDTEDKVALGIGLPSLGRAAGMTYVEDGGDEEQEEDEELEAFEALSFAGRLQRVVGYLRKEYHYCFWCKYKYEDEDMDGCPGSDEDLHG